MSESDPQAEPKTKAMEQCKYVDMSGAAIEARWNKMWQLSVEAWAAKGIDITEAPMRKDVERLTTLHDQ